MHVREDLWDVFVAFVDNHDNLWTVGRDFNFLQYIYEILGTHARSQGAIGAFNLTLIDCRLKDVGFVGSLFI